MSQASKIERTDATRHMDQDSSHAWRYASKPYPAPDGIKLTLHLRGEPEPQEHYQYGRTFYKMDAGYFGVFDPANGGSSVYEIERGLIARVEIAAL